MPESEPKPKLIELVGPGAGQGWKAVLRNGKAVVVHEIPVPPAEAAAAVPRLQRLYEHPHPALSPVLAWGTDNNGLWVAVEANEGTPLGTILSRGHLTPPAAAALGAAVLSGVAALHETGIAMGGFNATAVRVTSNGDVRLAGHPAAAVRGAPSQSDLRADVRSAGMAVCAAFGVDPAGAPAPPNIPPGLVVTMRSMASGAMGPSADRAQAALREMASALLAPDREVAAQSELALRAGGREVPPITPFLPQQPTPVRSPASYEAPDRPLQTYPPRPSFTVPPAPPVPPVPPPAAPPAPAAPEARPTPPAVPTWADAPPRTSIPPEPAPAARATNPPAPAPPAPAPAPAPPAVPPEPPSEPPAPKSAFEGLVATPPEPATPAPKPAEPASPPPAPTWSPVEPPVWKPGEIAAPAAAGAAAAAASTSAPTPSTPSPSAPVAPVPPRAPTRPPTPARQPSVARPHYGGEPPRRPGWLIPAAVAIIVLVLLGIGGIVLTNRGSNKGGPVALTTPSPKATTSPKASASATPTSHAPLTVPSYADAKSDPITKVQFCTSTTPCPIARGVPDETATNCDLNSCTIEVAIYFTSNQNVPVAYNLEFFDRCAGTTKELPGPPDYTPPNYAVVIPRDKWAVSIPGGVKSGALVAVARKPAVAASAPLLLGSTDTC